MLEKYRSIFISIEEVGSDFHNEFGNTYQEQSKKINIFIVETKKKVKLMKLNELKVKNELEVSKELEKLNRYKKDKINHSFNIYENICDRLSNLEIRCVKVHELSDVQLLDHKKNLRLFDSDFNDVLDRITRFCEVSPSDCTETKDMLRQITARKNNLQDSLKSFKEKLGDEIIKHDLTYEKLKKRCSF